MKWGVAFGLALCALVLLPGLTGSGPFDTHEAKDLEVARELIVWREGLTPLYGVERLFEKPLLAYAPDVLARLAAPVAPLAASRVWRVAVAMLLVLLTAATAARHLGARAGLLAGIVLATSLAFPLASRLDGTVLLGTLLGWTAIDGFTHVWFDARGGRDARLIVAYGALACSMVAVGPLAALWPLAAAGIYQALTHRKGAWRELRVGPGLLIVLGLALPWYGAMLERHGSAFVAHVLAYPYGESASAPWYTAPFLAVSFLIVGCFPWSALLPGALQHAAVQWRTARVTAGVATEPPPSALERGRESKEEHAAHWFIACALGAMLPLLFHPRAPITAILPALPAVAALCGRLLDHVIEDQARAGTPMFRGAQMLSLTGSVGAVLLLMVAGRIGAAAPAVRLLGTAMFILCWLPFLAALTGRFRLAALLVTLPIAVGTPLACVRVLPAIEGYVTSRPVAAAVERYLPPHAPVLLYDDPPPSLRALTAHNLVRAEWYAAPFVGASLGGASLGGASLMGGVPAAADGWVYMAYRPARESDVRAAVARAPGATLEVLTRTPGLVLARVRG